LSFLKELDITSMSKILEEVLKDFERRLSVLEHKMEIIYERVGYIEKEARKV